MGDYLVDGNYCDMFDCGEYCYAISNLMHLGLGEFKNYFRGKQHSGF